MSVNSDAASHNTGLDDVLKIVNELAQKSVAADYIYRGEPECYQKISSSFYRSLPAGLPEGSDIDNMQAGFLTEAREFTFEGDDFAILAELQHYGGKTNLIDFTADYLIALFFACSSGHNQEGRVILLERTGAMQAHIHGPRNPVNRVIAQKSVFVQPPMGYIDINTVDMVFIPGQIKRHALEYLRKSHGISARTVYNDLHGFIRYRENHQNAYDEFYAGLSRGLEKDYEQAKEHFINAVNLNFQMFEAYNNLGVVYAYQHNYRQAVEYFSQAIELGQYHAGLYANRGEAWLHLSEWDKAQSDLTIARDKGVDIVGWFHHDYDSVADFERRNGTALPPDIAEMLGG